MKWNVKITIKIHRDLIFQFENNKNITLPRKRISIKNHDNKKRKADISIQHKRKSLSKFQFD